MHDMHLIQKCTYFHFNSYESGILEDPNQEAPESLYQITTAPEKAPNEVRFVHKRFRPTLYKSNR